MRGKAFARRAGVFLAFLRAEVFLAFQRAVPFIEWQVMAVDCLSGVDLWCGLWWEVVSFVVSCWKGDNCIASIPRDC